MANRSNAIEGDIFEINRLLDINKRIIDEKTPYIKETLVTLKTKPQHELRKKMNTLEATMGKVNKGNLETINKLNELATEINAAIGVINQNIQLSQNDIKSAISEGKINIENSQRTTYYTKKTGGRRRRRQRKTRKL